MTIHTSPTPTEIEASVKETIHSLLQRYPEHNRGSVLNEVLRHSFQTITIEYGKTLPKELRWCEKLPTIVLLEEPIPAENQLMAEPTTQNDTITTQDKPITERCSTPNDTTHDSSSATQDTPNPESLPKPDNTTQDGASATQDASSPERSSTSDNTSTPKPSSTSDAIIQELMAQAENFAVWTKDPSLFWNFQHNRQRIQAQQFMNEKWNKATAFRNIYHKTVHNLDIQKVLNAVETSGANLAAKTVLQYRQALIQGQPALSIGKFINCTLNQSEAENTFQEPRAPADESNGTVASKRSSTEAGLDDPTASKRSRQNMDILVDAVMCQSATASETVIANDSNLHIVQPNNAPSLNNTSSPNSEINQNLVDPDPVEWVTYLDTVESNLNVFELFGDGEPDFDYSFGDSSLDTTGPSDLIKTTETLQVGS
ncbi:hypothetical protein V8C35DRAFT_278185 [Trichoderma chlorosporum]